VVAINPVDWKFQDWNPIPQHTYPRILGFDIAGEVVGVGEGSRFEIGQRVVAYVPLRRC
jgi:NADPH:quinone reductase-like Zn-dependent oxidoreductase